MVVRFNVDTVIIHAHVIGVNIAESESKFKQAYRNSTQAFIVVIPAKAGIHHRCYKFQWQVMDPRLRGGDEVYGLEATGE
jgi:hypothetical protein